MSPPSPPPQIAPLLSTDCKRSITQSISDLSSNHNPQQHQQHFMTCSEMTDVWISEIGPKLDVVDIVRLSMVNQWARRIAHNIKPKSDCTTVAKKYRKGVVAWPDLRWHLTICRWGQTDVNDSLNSKWCDVVSLVLDYCEISDFSFVETQRIGAGFIVMSLVGKFKILTQIVKHKS